MSLATGALYDQGSTLFGKIIMVIMSAVLGFMVFYTIFRYYKNAPHIVVNDNSISLNSRVYYWRDLEKIEMTGKWSFKFMAEQKEGMLLKFKGEGERFIFDDMYENSHEIKSFIETIASEKTAPNDISIVKDVVETHIITPIDTNEVKPVLCSETDINKMTDVDLEGQKTSDGIQWFKGFPLCSFDGIIFGVMILVMPILGIFSFIKVHDASSLTACIILTSLIFIFSSRRMHYFGISDRSLIVTSYHFPWLKRDYVLEDIKEIVFEQRSRLPITLRIINKDFTSKTYQASTLWDKTWMQLKTVLESKNIKVRNECVVYDDEPVRFKFFND